MGWKATVRAMEAAQRRQQRAALRHQRELEQRAKEQEKLSVIERARLAVETFESQLESLLSIHKECSETLDWKEFTTALPPPAPERKSYYELRTRQPLMVLSPNQKGNSEAQIEQAQSRDEQLFKEEAQTYWEQKGNWERLKILSRRVLAGEHKSYTEAFTEFNPFIEMSNLGSSINFIVHTARLIECVLKINGKRAIPAELKSLTASGKVSVRAMPKGRFHEIYQDYLSGCVLRVGREALALLPVDTVLITALADFAGTASSHSIDQAVLSVVMSRGMVAQIDFDQLDSSDAIEKFQHRGDFKSSRKSENFRVVEPFTPADIAQHTVEDMSLDDLLATVQKTREEIKARLAETLRFQNEIIPEANPQI